MADKKETPKEQKAGSLGAAYLIVSIAAMGIWAIKQLRQRRK